MVGAVDMRSHLDPVEKASLDTLNTATGGQGNCDMGNTGLKLTG